MTDLERERVREIVEGFKNPGLNALGLYREVLLKQVTLEQFTSALASPEHRALAYEMALGVCEADDVLNEAERAYLGRLRAALGLATEAVSGVHREAEALATSAIPPVLGAATARAASPVASAPADPAADAELDGTILNHAILAGALELLPSSMATMAIIPLQMRLVYQVGRRFGVELDRGHIGEFLATAGIGMTSQVLEGYATKLMKGLLGTVAGGLGRGLAGSLTGSAMSFATTYAVGQLARRYYAGGRSLSGLQMRETFESLLGQAKGLQQQYMPQIRERSRGLDVSEVIRLARGR
ncbi:MAG: hypothetical protein JNL97_08885 [Verrucomicrobiales bacterium]|nr:hypothetical protein [Verrucomicrobiales bacterium]